MKGQKQLAEEAKQWFPIENTDARHGTLTADQLLQGERSAMLMIYPDFKMDKSVVSEFAENKKRMLLNDGKSCVNENAQYRSKGHVMNGRSLPSVQCLKAFEGMYVVHVGELFGCTWSAMNVWGKTTSKEFQIELQSHFHKVYEYELTRWPLFRDTLTVWKRKKTVSIGQERVLSQQPEMCVDKFQTEAWNSWFAERLKNRVDPKRSNKNAMRVGAVLKRK